MRSSTPIAGSFAQNQQQQPREARQEEQRQERNVHAVLLGVDDGRVAPPLQRVESHGPDQQANAAERSQHHRQAQVRMRRDVSGEVVDRRNGGRREAQQESVKREVMKAAASPRMVFVRIRAAGAVAVEILESQHIARSSEQCGQRRPPPVPKTAAIPLRAREDERRDDAERGDHDVVRDDAVEIRALRRAPARQQRDRRSARSPPPATRSRARISATRISDMTARGSRRTPAARSPRTRAAERTGTRSNIPRSCGTGSPGS